MWLLGAQALLKRRAADVQPSCRSWRSGQTRCADVRQGRQTRGCSATTCRRTPWGTIVCPRMLRRSLAVPVKDGQARHGSSRNCCSLDNVLPQQLDNPVMAGLLSELEQVLLRCAAFAGDPM